MVLALIAVRSGGLLGGVPAARQAAPWRGEAGRSAPIRGAADDFPLIQPGSAAATRPAPVPPPPPPLATPTATISPTLDLRPPSMAPVPPATPQPRPEPDEWYLVQLGSYRLAKTAREDQARFRALGLDPRLSLSGEYLVLRLPRCDTLEEAQRVMRELRARGLEPVLLGPRSDG
jgi:cell division protein FtsN